MSNLYVMAEESGIEKKLGPIFPAPAEVVLGLVAFGLLLFVLWKFVVPRFEALYKERAEKIEGGIEKAERLQAEAEEQLQKYKALLADAN
ncbi:F0F1 ATP synthase subunit B, partial [Kibdelosporangium lantanae]